VLDRAQRLRKRFARFMFREGLHDRAKRAEAGLLRGRPGERGLLLGVVRTDQLERMFEPAESTTAMFGGNPNFTATTEQASARRTRGVGRPSSPT
jgi:hypothetical protein